MAEVYHTFLQVFNQRVFNRAFDDAVLDTRVSKFALRMFHLVSSVIASAAIGASFNPASALDYWGHAADPMPMPVLPEADGTREDKAALFRYYESLKHVVLNWEAAKIVLEVEVAVPAWCGELLAEVFPKPADYDPLAAGSDGNAKVLDDAKCMEHMVRNCSLLSSPHQDMGARLKRAVTAANVAILATVLRMEEDRIARTSERLARTSERIAAMERTALDRMDRRTASTEERSLELMDRLTASTEERARARVRLERVTASHEEMLGRIDVLAEIVGRFTPPSTGSKRPRLDDEAT